MNARTKEQIEAKHQVTARPDEWAGKMPAGASVTALEYGTGEPSEVVKTCRVLTITSADEY